MIRKFKIHFRGKNPEGAAIIIDKEKENIQTKEIDFCYCYELETGKISLYNVEIPYMCGNFDNIERVDINALIKENLINDKKIIKDYDEETFNGKEVCLNSYNYYTSSYCYDTVDINEVLEIDFHGNILNNTENIKPEVLKYVIPENCIGYMDKNILIFKIPDMNATKKVFEFSYHPNTGLTQIGDDMIKYNTVEFDTFKDGSEMKLIRSDGTEIKLLKKNIYEFFKHDNSKGCDMKLFSGFISKEFRVNRPQNNIKSTLWYLCKNHSKNLAICYEIMGKSKYAEIFNLMNNTNGFKLNKNGTNPQTISGFSKSTLNFLLENKAKISTSYYVGNTFNNFSLNIIKELEDKYGPNFKYLFEVNEKIEKITRDIIYNSDCLMVGNHFISIQEMELLYSHNYLKNIDKLIEYIYDILPNRQGIYDIRDAHILLFNYIRLVDEMEEKKMPKYPDSLKKEIDLLHFKKKIRDDKEKIDRMKKIREIKKDIFSMEYDNYYVEPLLTETALAEESARMNNCVRSYTDTLTKLNRICVSIRDKKDKSSVCTLELNCRTNHYQPYSLKELNEEGIKLLEANFYNAQLKAKSNAAPSQAQRTLANKYIEDINNKISAIKTGGNIQQIAL